MKTLYILLFCLGSLFASVNEDLARYAGEGNNQKIKTLIENGAKINKINSWGKLPLIEATRYSKHSTMRLLIEMGADTELKDENQQCALNVAVCRDDVEGVKILLAAKADTETRGIFKRTPLINACLYGKSISMIRLLVKNRAKLYASDYFAMTPIMCAYEMKHYKLVEELIRLNAKRPFWYNDRIYLFERAKEGWTLEVLRILKSGIDVNIQDDFGNTAIYYAVLENKTKLVKTLLSLGANSRIKNKKGVSALSLAKRIKNVKLYSILKGSRIFIAQKSK